MNECYKCKEPVDVPQETVHPLCAECEAEFDQWLAESLRLFS